MSEELQEVAQGNKEVTQEAAQEFQEAVQYVEHVGPLVNEILTSIHNFAEKNNHTYTEFEVYDALALAITQIIRQALPENLAAKIHQQSAVIADVMVQSAIQAAQQSPTTMTAMVLAGARTTSFMVDIVTKQIEEVEKQQASQEVAASTEE